MCFAWKYFSKYEIKIAMILLSPFFSTSHYAHAGEG